MDELFIQYLWRYQKFDNTQLQLTDGRTLVVFETGNQNEHSGPDFKEAKIKIDELIWSGSVEIHHKSSDWNRHNHDTDRAYDNVILHVVWTHDLEIKIDNQPIPTLQLSGYVSESITSSYKKYINQPDVIRCSGYLTNIPSITISGMLDRALASRLQQKSNVVLASLKETNNNWEETAYRILAKNFGFKTNSEIFERLASSLPYSILRKYHSKPDSVNALVFGMSGFLENEGDEYHQKLKSEFSFLAKKHRLEPQLMRHHWKFAKMRPANFPSVRLAQFAAILTNNHNLFAQLIAIDHIKEAKEIIQKPLPDYWKDHYDFGKTSTRSQLIGSSSLENIIINSVVPILVAYSVFLNEPSYLEKAQQLLENLPSEQNSIIKKWNAAGVNAQHAGDSQAQIYQFNELCNKKRCLNCSIGISVLNRPK